MRGKTEAAFVVLGAALFAASTLAAIVFILAGCVSATGEYARSTQYSPDGCNVCTCTTQAPGYSTCTCTQLNCGMRYPVQQMQQLPTLGGTAMEP